jgi:hypothetical protein
VIWVTALLLLFALRDRGTPATPGQARAAESAVAGAAATSAVAVVPAEPLSQDAHLP